MLIDENPEPTLTRAFLATTGVDLGRFSLSADFEGPDGPCLFMMKLLSVEVPSASTGLLTNDLDRSKIDLRCFDLAFFRLFWGTLVVVDMGSCT